MNIWKSLPRPFFALAPLEGVTDTVFRQIVVSTARPDIFFTEFTSAEGFCSEGKDHVAQNFLFSEKETPIIAQLWGKDPDMLYRTAGAVSAMGFAGIDVNMGCPVREVLKTGCGAAMIDTPDVAREAIAAVKKGAGTLPVSIKTRLGNKTIVTERWITFLLEQGIDALTIHGRTAKELSRVPAHWDEIGKAVAIRDRMRVPTVIIGNGDVTDAKDAMQKHKSYGVDGVMIGRGIFQNLWAFDRAPNPHQATPKELIDILETHVRLFYETWGDGKSFATMRKFFKIYVNGFHGATDWRVKFMATNTAEEALALAKELRTCL
ncbi:MAG TPA: tRNA-dihydrouridine synthase [Patescibacteria group bacterium]|nr:tRNA-dihydrouridine synthase [Patescibacteria group bacterium]